MPDTERHRLLWQCRRGTRETGLLLERFVKRCYDTLDNAERHCLGALLERSEPELLDLLTGHVTPSDTRTANLLRRIRMHAKP